MALFYRKKIIKFKRNFQPEENKRKTPKAMLGKKHLPVKKIMPVLERKRGRETGKRMTAFCKVLE